MNINMELVTLCLLEAGSTVTCISDTGNEVEQNKVTCPTSCKRPMAELRSPESADIAVSIRTKATMKFSSITPILSW